MVVLNKIYTRTGDEGSTALGSGDRVSKANPRIEAYGTVDEANAAIGMARLHATDDTFKRLNEMLGLIQNELFDLGADLCVPDRGQKLAYEPLRIVETQWRRIEADIDELNEGLAPLRSFVLPAGHALAVQLHLARTITRRAERLMVALAAMPDEPVSSHALIYVNRLSDFLFVASRWVNARSDGDVLWQPGKTR